MNDASNHWPTPSQAEAIVAELTRRIVGGEWGPGARIPPQAELEQWFDAGNPTIQQALNAMARSGFVESRGTSGTFVSAHPPHLSRYALALPGHHADPGLSSRFWTALATAAGVLQRRQVQGKRQIPLFYDIDGHPDAEDYLRLVGDVRAHRLAGLVYAGPATVLAGTPLETPDLPRVILVADPGHQSPQSPVRYVDYGSFLSRALDYVASPAGGRRRRVAMVAQWEALCDPFLKEAKARGLMTQPWWVQVPQVFHALSVQHAVRLLMDRPANQRPDVLIIADDNYVEHATQGLAATGLHVPDDVLVVAFCNFPTPPPSVTPVVRLGFDAQALLQTSLDCIDQQRRGEPVQMRRLLPAVFEHELPPPPQTAG